MTKKVLVLADYYRPAQKGGGAVRSLETHIATIGIECEYYVITRDHDLGERRTFNGVSRGAWNRVGRATVYYERSGVKTMVAFWRALKQFDPNFVYLGSVVAVWYSIVPILILRLTGWISDGSRHQLVVAPRGQFGAGALNVKPLRKRVFLALSRLIGFHSGIIWHASNQREADEITRWMGTRARIRVASDIWKPHSLAPNRVEKAEGSARIIYVSRISPEKNLLMAIRILARVSGQIDFVIHGPIASNDYWEECQRELARLPSNIKAEYRGSLASEDVSPALGRAHLFLFPTPGENFGHVILESLSAGCPVLCSDQTPWGAIEGFGAGWVESLGQPQRFALRVEQMIEMGAAQWLEMSEKARVFAESHGQQPDAIQENRALFEL